VDVIGFLLFSISDLEIILQRYEKNWEWRVFVWGLGVRGGSQL
jgi:hypothetical protein